MASDRAIPVSEGPATGFMVREADFLDAAGIAAVHVAGWRDAYREIIDAGYLESLSDIRHAAMWADVLDQEIRDDATADLNGD